MAVTSLIDVSSIINQQIQFQENIHEHLLKAEAVASVVLSDDFLDYKHSIIHAYLWALCNMISVVKSMNEQALNLLLKEERY